MVLTQVVSLPVMANILEMVLVILKMRNYPAKMQKLLYGVIFAGMYKEIGPKMI